MTQKNHKFLIEVFNEILKIDNKIHLVLVGLGELKQDVENQVKSLGIEDNVHFLGARRDVPEFLSGIDLLLFPSLYEGLSVAMIEAQASGVPILTSTSISDEVAITNLVNMMSLNIDKTKWARNAVEIISKSTNADRSKYALIVSDKGFDIEVLSKKMQSFYLEKEQVL